MTVPEFLFCCVVFVLSRVVKSMLCLEIPWVPDILSTGAEKWRMKVQKTLRIISDLNTTAELIAFSEEAYIENSIFL